ncbi:hypothetical protein ACQEV2_43555 [Streptomyces sp. CA-251387]|uniref:hypothetical protein n=1 Tax=Streptomyces sp. CA-251387 TaxID=3240064 RepID=UPI003D8F3BE0
MRLPKPPRSHCVNGRLPKHGPEFRFTKPETWPEPALAVQSWRPPSVQVRPRLSSRCTGR